MPRRTDASRAELFAAPGREQPVQFGINNNITGGRSRAVSFDVSEHELMNALRFKRGLISGALFCRVLAFFIGWFTSFEPHWCSLKDGMTQSEVKQVLGSPNWIGTSGCIGAGGKDVIRWEYRRWVLWRRVHYYVDFDYIGIGGASVVYRTERFREEWDWPDWCPWRAKIRA